MIFVHSTEKCGDYEQGKFSFYGQPVYNANRYAKLVKKRDRLQNWLDYYQLKFERHPEKRPTGRVILQHCFYFFFHSLIYQVVQLCSLCIMFARKSLSMLIFLVFQTGCLGFCGREVDQIDYYQARISELERKVSMQFLMIWSIVNDIHNSISMWTGKSSLFPACTILTQAVYCLDILDGIGTPESSQWPKSCYASFFCYVWL